MDFRFTEAQEQLRLEIRSFLDEAWPDEKRDLFTISPFGEDSWADAREFTAKLAAKGWMVPAWPIEHGGLGLGYLDYSIFLEELAYAGAPNGGRFPGVEYLGPILIRHGTEDQKRRYLPRIVDGTDVWCQGFSEPGSGSDLSSLSTRAVRDGDDYVVNGQKIWTGHGPVANRCFLLARTDPDAPRHAGIGFFLTDMSAPGITMHPLVNLPGEEGFAQVFFDNVRIAKENLVGAEGAGWTVATELLNRERMAAGTAATSRRLVRAFAAVIKDRLQVPDRVRHKLADLAIRANICGVLSLHVAAMLDRGIVPVRESSTVKLMNSELLQDIAAFGFEIFGMYGQLMTLSHWNPNDGSVARSLLWSSALTIAGGTSEIQRNIIAARGLGLPRQ